MLNHLLRVALLALVVTALAADSSEEKAPSMAPLGRPASLPPARRTVELVPQGGGFAR